MPFLSVAVIILFWVVFVYSVTRPGLGSYKVFIADSVDWLIKTTFQDPRGMILTSMPALSWQDTPEEMESPGRALLSWVAGVARLDLNPVGILRAQIPLLGQVEQSRVSVITVGPEIPLKDEEPIIGHDLSEDTLVGIYNTHTGETYSLTEGTDRVKGRGGVVKVAQVVQQTLEEKFSIKVARTDKIHDEQYATSYLVSEKTARELVAKNPKMIMMLDIHRDGGRSREQSLVEIKGSKIAPILIIVGSDARRPFPNWKQNYQFACRLSAKLDEIYPGLCMGVRVKEGRYNQFLHPGAILVEVGTDNNSLDEAIVSAEMLAEALSQVINEEITAREALKIKEGSSKTYPEDESLEGVSEDGNYENEMVENV